ncbi:MAG: acetate--CoA ligase family protein [Actinobacteria bacterium]|nr:acetate--CoA ligase family protein [Actinomycetota bacterium]
MPAPPGTATTRTLSEAASKALVASYGIPVLSERVVAHADAASEASVELGFPVVVKLCGDRIAHKTERGLVRLGLGDAPAVHEAAEALLAAATPADGDVALLVAPMVSGDRELIIGMNRDAQFGPTVMVGLGGVLAEAVADVAIGLAPLDAVDAEDLIDSLATRRLLGEFRGQPAVDRAVLTDALVGLSRLAVEHPEVVSVDVNPLVVVAGRPVAVDALVEVTA